MAVRAQPLRPGPGIAAAGILAVLILAPLVAVALRAEAGSGLRPADWAAVRFTLVQAVLSAALSVALAVPVARALARRRFVGREALVTLLGAPFLLPVIVAVLGILTVYGRSGWISAALDLVGLPPLRIYGLTGVVLAHVFFNLPLATRLILQGWQGIPAERFRLAAHLGFGPGEIRRFLEWPMLVRVVPGAFAVIFAVCLTSFAVALTLGGGPRATTVELAIYEAFRFDFDLARAARLAVIQLVLTLGAAALAMRLSPAGGFGAGLDRAGQAHPSGGWGLRIQDTVVIFLAAAFLILPLAAIIGNGLAGIAALPPAVWRSVFTSLGVLGMSLTILAGLSMTMVTTLATGRARWVEFAGLLGLAVSPLVLGTGAFLLLNPLIDPAALALPLTAMTNAVMALPFVLRILVPPARTVVDDYGRLGAHLNMGQAGFARLVLIPRLARPIGFAAGLGGALSLGDLGVIALFADPERATLPLQIFRLMGAYRMEAAASAALLLMMLAFGWFWLCDGLGRRHA
ncbi:MAG: thiamine/thiamine pyrophosphate ABC transporter permease ThiP [Marinibacterium sp.]